MTEVASSPSLVANWREILRTGNPPEGKLDPVGRWLVLTRAAVLPMTLTAGLIAGLLAIGDDGFRPALLALSVVGITLAHMSNNLMNDLADTDVGSDTENYPRALYAPHPILSGMITRRSLALSALVVNLLDLGIMLALFVERGWPIIAFAVAGFVLSFAYTAPPLRLKKRGLGELDVMIVWGPLMVGGTYYAAVGHLPWQIVLASVPYALLCTTVLMGKHIDKAPWDAPQGIKTLPVILGEQTSRKLTQLMMVGFYVSVVVAVAVGALPWPSLAALGALPALRKVWQAFDRPRPEKPPRNFPVWPLWFAPIAFLHTRRAGALLLLGLLVAAIFGIN
jgi:1,4-dihydroxy-2-naphthoate octaprenyltransferase